MENKQTAEVTVSTMTNEEMDTMLKALSEASNLPRGLVDDIFNLGVKAERNRQAEKVLKKMAKKDKKKKDPLNVRIARRLGYAPIPKESKKDEVKK